MVRNAGTCLYKEARLNIEPAHPGSTVSFTLPASSGHTFGLQTRAKRSVIDESDALKDDEAFAKRHLATDGSMFFRRRGSYPRSFLWRVLDGRKTLEIQATDLDHDARDPYEANLTLLFHFTSPIRPFCVAFADPDHRNALTVFAITTANELYCITLPCEFFARPSVSEVEIDDWCKRTVPNLISANTAYRLVAVNANQLLVSLGNGSVLRLVRDNRDDVIWTEATFQNTNWSLTLRGVLPWKGQQTVRFGNTDLVATSAAAVAISPDDQHLITVCLDHTLRIFNLQSGKMTRQHDLLNLLDGAQERNQSHLLGPSQSTLMQVVNISGAEGAAYYIVVYSPIRHEFKFWGVRDAEMDDQVAFTDLQSDFSFIPPIDELMNATVWTLEEFFLVKAPGSSWKGTELWLRARSGPSSKVYSITFDPSDDEDRLQRVWKFEWTNVDSGPLSVEGLRNNPSHPGEQDWESSDINEFDATEQWLQFLFYPGRFTTATLEAALSILRKGLDRDRSAGKPKGSLKDRLCASILEATKLQRRGSDVETFERNTAEQWEAYYRLVKDLHKRRGESLSLAYDYAQDMPWLVLSDYLSAVRKSSMSETIANNAASTLNGTQLSPPLRRALNKQASESRDLLRLLNAAASFRRRLSPSFQQDLKQRLQTDLLQSRPITIIDRMEQMEADCGLTDILTEDDLASLIEDLGTDVKHLSTDMFLDALETLKFESRGGSRKQTQIARYGLKALVRISSEFLDFNYETLLDLLVLILFMQFEEDLSDEFDASKVFVELMLEFKDWLVLNWIATTVWSRPTPTGPASTQLMKSMRQTSKTSSQFPITQTALEGMYGDGTCLIEMPATMKTELLTYWSQNWIASIFSQHTFDSAVEDMMGKLVFQKEYKLAKDFSKFLPESNWSTYLKGRMHIALGEHVLASVCFQKAAYNLALGSNFAIDMADSARLVPEHEQDLFSEGLPRYYSHILGLFEKVQAHSFMADFARLGLSSIMGSQDEKLKTELLQRLLTASLQTSKFEEAYTTMTRLSNAALKRSALQSIITSMIAQGQTTALLKFPFVGLTEDVDTILFNLCSKILNLGSGPPYHQILYAFRISRGNFRGAATILHDRLQRLKSTSTQIHDPADESLIQCYLMIINALSSVSHEDAYILADQRVDDAAPHSWQIGQAKKLLRRKIITLDTLRKEYQAELDRVAAIENGHFAFMDPTDEMDIL